MNIKHALPEGFLDGESKEIFVDTDKKKIWAVELDLLAEFDSVCRKNGLRYAIAYGTLLGAVRHHGFIPWDDDIDVVLPRKDYDRLCEIGNDVFKEPYFLQTDFNSIQACRGHAQLRNVFTTGILKSELLNGKGIYDFCQGIFLDVFPLDSIPNDEGEFSALCEKIDALKVRIQRWRYCLAAFDNRKFMKLGTKSTLRGWGYSFVGGQKLLLEFSKRLQEEMKLYQDDDVCERVSLLALGSRLAKRFNYEKMLFDELVEIPFEGLNVFAPKSYEKMLLRDYGDWHRHVVGAAAHGGVLFNTERSYSDYLITK